MNHRFSSMLIAAAAATLAIAGTPAHAFSPIVLSTGAPGWMARYAGGQGPAFAYTQRCVTASPCMSISSTGFRDGAFVGGGTAAAFDGRWYATLEFFVPAHPGAVRMDLQIQGVDDRATLRINGVPLIMIGRQEGAEWAVGLVGGPLKAGQVNVLEIEVINSPTRIDGRPVGFQGAGDGTAISLAGAVTALP